MSIHKGKVFHQEGVPATVTQALIYIGYASLIGYELEENLSDPDQLLLAKEFENIRDIAKRIRERFKE